jgi:hypothetical protein
VSPCCYPCPDGQLQRDVVRQVFEVGDVALLPLLQHPDLLTFPAQLGSLLGEESGRTATGFPHHSTNLAPFALKTSCDCYIVKLFEVHWKHFSKKMQKFDLKCNTDKNKLSNSKWELQNNSLQYST